MITQKIRYKLIELLAGKTQIMMNVDFTGKRLAVKKPAHYKNVRFLGEHSNGLLVPKNKW